MKKNNESQYVDYYQPAFELINSIQNFNKNKFNDLIDNFNRDKLKTIIDENVTQLLGENVELISPITDIFLKKAIWLAGVFRSEVLQKDRSINVLKFVNPSVYNNTTFQDLKDCMTFLGFYHDNDKPILGIYKKWDQGKKILPMFDVFLEPPIEGVDKNEITWYPSYLVFNRVKKEYRFGVDSNIFIGDLFPDELLDNVLTDIKSVIHEKSKSDYDKLIRIENIIITLENNITDDSHTNTRVINILDQLSVDLKKPALKSETPSNFLKTLLLLLLPSPRWSYYYYLPAQILPWTAVGSLAIATKEPLPIKFIEVLKHIINYLFFQIAVLEGKQRGEEKGAVNIASGVAHNLRNTLRGFKNSLYNIAHKYPRTFLQGRAVEDKIGWLDLVSRETISANTIRRDLVEILLRSFDTAWGLILLQGEKINKKFIKVDLVEKYKVNNIIYYPILKLIYKSNSVNLITISFTTLDREGRLMNSTWSKTTLYKIPTFQEEVYNKYMPLLKYKFEGDNLDFNEVGNIILEKYFLTIPEDAVGGIEGSLEEIFYNALKYNNEANPVCISCDISNLNTIEIINRYEYTGEEPESGGGRIGNDALYKRLGWKYNIDFKNNMAITQILMK